MLKRATLIKGLELLQRVGKLAFCRSLLIPTLSSSNNELTNSPSPITSQYSTVTMSLKEGAHFQGLSHASHETDLFALRRLALVCGFRRDCLGPLR